MKTKVENINKKGKKRSLSETSVSIKSNQKQEIINEFKKGPKKAKFANQNGSPMLGEKAPIRKMDKQKKEQNKIIKQQSNIVKPLEIKRDAKEKTDLTIVKPKKEISSRASKSRRRKYPYNSLNLTIEQITKKIAEIKSREVLSKRAKKILGILNRKLRECENENKSEKLDIVGKKNNKKMEHHVNALIKNKQKTNDENKIKVEKKHIQSKGKPQEEEEEDDDDDDNDSDVEEDDIEEDSEEDESEVENISDLLSNKNKEIDNESDEDEKEEEDEDEEEVENEENESEEDEEIESEEDEEAIESEEDEEEIESEEDEEEDESEEEEDEDDADEDEEEKNIIKILSERKKEIQNKNKQATQKNKQGQKNMQEQNKNKQDQDKSKQEKNKNKQVLQSLDKQSKEEMKKKRYVLFVGNLPLNITQDEIKQHFLTKIDTITSIRIPTKPDKTPRGFAYVEVTNNIDFEKGLSLNHTFLKKNRINVQYSIPTGSKKTDATKKFIVAKNMKLQALQKTGKLADGNKKKLFKKEK